MLTIEKTMVLLFLLPYFMHSYNSTGREYNDDFLRRWNSVTLFEFHTCCGLFISSILSSLIFNSSVFYVVSWKWNEPLLTEISHSAVVSRILLQTDMSENLHPLS
jgi:hypothetical protein